MASEPDTIYVNVRINEESSSVSSQSKTGSLLSKGLFFIE